MHRHSAVGPPADARRPRGPVTELARSPTRWSTVGHAADERRRGGCVTEVTPTTAGTEAPVDVAAEGARIAANMARVVHGKPDVVHLALVVLLAEGHLLVEDVPGVGKTTLAKALAASVDASVRRIQFTPDLLPSDVTGVSVYDQETREFEFKPGAIFANVVVADEINRASPKTQSAMLDERATTDPLTELAPVTDAAHVRELVAAVRRLHVAEPLRRYVVSLVEA